MVNVAVQPQTKTRLNFAIDQYCAEVKLDTQLKTKISYDYIINRLLDTAEVKQ